MKKLSIILVLSVLIFSNISLSLPAIDVIGEIRRNSLTQNQLHELIKNGFDINAEDRYGDLPLVEAAVLGHLDMVKLLIANGADINKFPSRRKYYSALGSSCDYETSKFLIEHGADVNNPNSVGKTPLMQTAQWCGDARLAKLLISNGADVTMKDNLGQTALDYAKKFGHTNLIELLQSYLQKTILEKFSRVLPTHLQNLFNKSSVNINAYDQFKSGGLLHTLLDKYPKEANNIKDFKYIFPTSGISQNQQQAVKKYKTLQTILNQTKKSMIDEATKLYIQEVDKLIQSGVKFKDVEDIFNQLYKVPGFEEKVKKILKLKI